MLLVDQAFPESIADQARGWFVEWRLAELFTDVQVRFSRRMFRAVGRCYPRRRLVTLADPVRVMDDAQILAVLCHEFAHIAAYEHYGYGIKPHGQEWRSLMRRAGYVPSVRFADAQALQLLHSAAAARPHYVHRCPLCRTQRIARRRMPRWRCGSCYEIGLDGLLQIIRVVPES